MRIEYPDPLCKSNDRALSLSTRMAVLSTQVLSTEEVGHHQKSQSEEFLENVNVREASMGHHNVCVCKQKHEKMIIIYDQGCPNRCMWDPGTEKIEILWGVMCWNIFL